MEVPKRGNIPPYVKASLDDLLRSAFLNRPELREIAYRQRINELENDAAELEVLPSLSGVLGINYSSNDLLFNQDWVSYGARVSWDLMNIGRLPRRKAAIEAGSELLDARALALTRAVATQVVVSFARYDSLRREVVTAAKYNDVSRKIVNQTRAQTVSGGTGEQALIQEEMEAILAELRHDLAYSEAQTAYANLYSSIGLNPYAPGVTGQESVETLAHSLRELWAKRENVSAVATNI